MATACAWPDRARRLPDCQLRGSQPVAAGLPRVDEVCRMNAQLAAAALRIGKYRSLMRAPALWTERQPRLDRTDEYVTWDQRFRALRLYLARSVVRTAKTARPLAAFARSDRGLLLRFRHRQITPFAFGRSPRRTINACSSSAWISSHRSGPKLPRTHDSASSPSMRPATIVFACSVNR